MKIIEKRYQKVCATGIQWTKWFPLTMGGNHSVLEPWQLKSLGLKNEYREVDENNNVIPINVSYTVMRSSSGNKRKEV